MPQDDRDPDPFELVDSSSKIYTCIVKIPQEIPVSKGIHTELKGPIKFSEYGLYFVTCNMEYGHNYKRDECDFIYIISTSDWKVEYKLVACPFAESLRLIPHLQAMKIVKSAILKDYFIFIEQVS